MLENLEKLTIEDIKYKVAIILTIFTGVRLSELMELEWQDVNFRNVILNIKSVSIIREYLQKFLKQKS